MRKPELWWLFALIPSLTGGGCGEAKQPTPAPSAPTPAPAPTPAAAAEPVRAAPKVLRVEGFQTPESVLHDDVADLYLVSNINGPPTEKDDNGYIARVSPEGKVVDAAWIDGKGVDVTLNAPKGMAFAGEVLYVCDIDTVRMFDRKTGAPKGEIALPKATFVNDVAVSAGVVYVSDSGLGADFKPTGSEAIWTLRDGKAARLTKVGDALGSPNGIAFDGDRLWVAGLGSGELYSVGADGRRGERVKLPTGGLDGIVVLADGTMLISSWEGQAVYAGKPGGAFTTVISGVQSPADIGFDRKRERVLVPSFEGNTVEIHPYAAR
jgi:sugar lactone lactonase YvrE